MNQDSITLEQLEKSKIYVKPGGGVSFRPALEYLAPVYDSLKNVSGIDFKLNALESSITQEVDSEELNIAYPRASLVASFNDLTVNRGSTNPFEEFIPQLGAIYCLDSASPFLRVFWGYEIKTCMNLSVWGTRETLEIKITSGINSLMDKAKMFIDTANEKVETSKRNIELLRSRTYKGTEYNEKIGELLRKSLRMPKLGYTTVTDAVKELDNPKSIYFAKDSTSTAWNIYNAITGAANKASFLDKPMKSAFIAELFLLPEQLN